MAARKDPGRKMTREQVAAAYKLYQAGFSIQQIAEQVWDRFEFRSVQICRQSLANYFRRDGYTIRSKSEAVNNAFRQGRLTPLTSEQMAALSAHWHALERSRIDVRTHCKNGHRWVPENIFRRADGGERCRLCRQESLLRSRARKRNPVEPQKKRAVAVADREVLTRLWGDGSGVPSERLLPIIQQWKALDETHTNKLVAQRLVGQLGGTSATFERRILYPLYNGELEVVPWAIADAILTEIDSDAWYYELADLYEEAA